MLQVAPGREQVLPDSFLGTRDCGNSQGLIPVFKGL